MTIETLELLGSFRFIQSKYNILRRFSPPLLNARHICHYCTQFVLSSTTLLSYIETSQHRSYDSTGVTSESPSNSIQAMLVQRQRSEQHKLEITPNKGPKQSARIVRAESDTVDCSLSFLHSASVKNTHTYQGRVVNFRVMLDASASAVVCQYLYGIQVVLEPPFLPRPPILPTTVFIPVLEYGSSVRATIYVVNNFPVLTRTSYARLP